MLPFRKGLAGVCTPVMFLVCRVFMALLVLSTGRTLAQDPVVFVPAVAEMEGTYSSGGTLGFTDVDNNGWDDLIILDDGHEVVVEFQGPDGFHAIEMGSLGNSSQWGACVGDLDNSGSKDLISGGSYDGVHCVRMHPGHSEPVVDLDNGSMFMQACTMSDLDGDGVLDLFACHDDALSRLWKGNTMEVPTPDAALMPLSTYSTTGYANTDHSGNYGVVTADVNGDGHTDVYIAKCRQFVNDPFDPRRINQLWMSDGEGGWTEEAGPRGLVLHEQSWTADFGDIDNDGDLDALITNHSAPMALLANDGTGHFTDITAGSGLGIAGFFLQAKLADFDNDGHLDVLTSGGSNAQHFLLGQGDGTFVLMDWPFSHPDDMLSFALGDAGRDGTLDVLASYGGVYVNPDPSNPDVLYLNSGGDHHWVGFDLQGVEGNPDAVGGRVALHGAWGTQLREVRAGESYGITCTHHAVFGLGTASTIDSAVVTFPGGFNVVLHDPEVDVYHDVLEAPCLIDPMALEMPGDSVLCPGVTLTLASGQPDLIHHWNTGETSTSIEVSEPGYYRALLMDGNGCAGLSHPLRVDRADDEVAAIGVIGELEGCEDRIVTLHAEAGGDWQWMDGTANDSIVVTENGTYHLSMVNGCGGTQYSDTLEVVFYTAPDEPVLEDIIVPLPDAVTLEGGGGTLQWFGAATGGDPLATGPSFITPVLDTTTVFWAESIIVHGLDEASGGEEGPSNGTFFNNENYWLKFDAHEDLMIDSVLVLADGAGSRTMGVVNAAGLLLDEVTVEVPDGLSYVALSLMVPEGMGYGLRCLGENPDLWRDGIGSALSFPYAVGDLLTITSNNLNNAANATNYYYYFYDWHVSSIPTVCHSGRVDLSVIALIEGCTYPSATNFEVAATHENGDCYWVGCMDETAINFHPIHTVANDDSCVYTMNPPEGCPADLNADGLTGSADLLMFLTDFGEACAQ